MSSSSLIDKCCLIGESVAGNPTHFMIERAFDSAELDWRFLTFQVGANRFDDALRGVEALGFRGVKLLAPFREPAAEQLEVLTERAQRTGAVSCLVQEEGRLIGDDLSGVAMTAAIENSAQLAGRHTALLGAGRAAASFADALLEQGIASLSITDANTEAAETLAARLKEHWPAVDIQSLIWDAPALDLPEQTDCVVAVASWPREEDHQAAALVEPRLRSGMLVVDARVGSARTPLLRAATDRNATIVDGMQVLVHETALALEAWTGVKIDRVILREAAEEFLGV